MPGDINTPSPPSTPLSPTPYKIALNRISPGERLIYYLYLPFLFLILFLLALLATLPYLFFKRARPRLLPGSRPDPKHPQSKYEWYGPEKDYPSGLALAPLGQGSGVKWRMWEMYGYFREFWHMTTRQGLQVGGVGSGVVMLIFQVEMMWHDYSANNITGYQDSSSGGKGDSSNELRGDSTCAYATGTGVANWGSRLEPLAWYGCYHGFICIICICLIGDELLNVRFGCFAPQWYRGGVGYTIMFLAAATLSTSPNWGVTSLIQLRYVILTVMFLFGTYNLFRTFACALGMATSGFRHTDYRVGRKPLRPWTESEWIDPYYRQNFIPPKYDRYFITEKWQFAVGDWSFPLERRPREDVERQMDELDGLDSFMMDGRIQKVWQRDPEEIRRMHGKIGRTVIHGGPKKMPPHMTNDLKQRERIHIGIIDPRNPPTEEEEEEMIKALNEDKGYFGIANWKPRTKSFGWWWFDMRRVWAVVCGLALMGVRIGLCVFDLDYSNLASYRNQYDQAKIAWEATNNGGPDASKCQYYQGSSVPIFVITGEGSYSGVTANMIWLGIWHTFLIGMCAAVILVSTSNNMWWGMHWPFPPMTLIGPRMSSMSVGITLGFVAFATLQQGFFFSNDSVILVTRIICYASVIGFILFLYPNEPLRTSYTRDPFWPWLSRVAFRFMDRKKWHYSMKDFDDAQG
ncbi:hypothetical protein C353_03810 [Cryptococcus neoformans AD1-83a]|nr:hypothetical protein C353_03810 [Cryptococcus neoformans var. grubii AD1-83a]